LITDLTCRYWEGLCAGSLNDGPEEKEEIDEPMNCVSLKKEKYFQCTKLNKTGCK